MNVLLVFLFASIVLGFSASNSPRSWHHRVILVGSFVLAGSYLSLRFV
jgi:hypothetical protein